MTGQDLAALLLGLPSGGLIDRSPDSFSTLLYQGVFVQDDWKMTDKLTLNLGLRYEYEGAPTERDDRNLRGFDPTAQLAISAAARSGLRAQPDSRAARQPVQRRAAVCASPVTAGAATTTPTRTTSSRGSASPISGTRRPSSAPDGRSTRVPQIFDDVIRQSGFAQSTTIVPTLDQGVTIQADAGQPLPERRAGPAGQQPPAPNTFLGRQLDRFTNDIDFKNGQAMRFAVSVQRELPGAWVLEAAYVGNRGFDLTTTTGQQVEQNPLPNQYLSTSPVRDQATINFLTANVANPFQGLLPGTNLNGATVAARSSCCGATRSLPTSRDACTTGRARYDSGQFRLERALQQGLYDARDLHLLALQGEEPRA